MKTKCDRCIHNKVCKFRLKEEYPQFMKRIISENCKYYNENNDERNCAKCNKKSYR